MPHALNAAFLRECIDLPFLTDQERGLMRELAHHYALGQAAEWGASNTHREPEVRALFNRIQNVQ